MNPLAILWQFRLAFRDGLIETVELLVIAAVLGTAFGLVLVALCRRSGSFARPIADALAFSVSGIPALVVLFWLYYPAQSLIGFSISPFATAATALTLMNMFPIYRITADAISAFPKQYVAAATVSGLSPHQSFRHIEAPILLRTILPRWIGQQIVILQTSLFASLIGVEETFRVAQRINSIIYQPVIIYSAMALLFLFVTGCATYLANRIGRHVDRDFSER